MAGGGLCQSAQSQRACVHVEGVLIRCSCTGYRGAGPCLNNGGTGGGTDLEPETAQAAKRYIRGQVPHSVRARVTSNVPAVKGRNSLPFRSPLNWKVVSSQPWGPFLPPASALRLRNAGPSGACGTLEAGLPSRTNCFLSPHSQRRRSPGPVPSK